MQYVYMALGWAATNAVALVLGGYLGYRFGDKVEGYVKSLLGVLGKVVSK